ncbi:endocuticle structural glycoprotein ABD-4-like [Cotesia glomerata]|uniref:Uncharacterized protein n=1 Tax=Cotesia glomerata TaxID=32391 RepID=A0AAV7IJU1_COTGL|nr:endocuticle structural glycoprotein ABD-4-like [Cotesia glomerata]KAH0561695.1 hypothetical protein KQX54_018842 [Cotesia glomerata]
MYKLAVILGLVSVVLSAPVDDTTTPVPIVKFEQDGPNPDGSYSFSYEGGNGVKAEEAGSLVQSANSESGQAMSVKGSFSYTGEDGVVYNIVYVADENGFQPRGDHIPTSPPIPEEILKGLEYNAAHPEENNIDAPEK